MIQPRNALALVHSLASTKELSIKRFRTKWRQRWQHLLAQHVRPPTGET